MLVLFLLAGVQALPVYQVNNVWYWQTNDTVPVATPYNTFGALTPAQKQQISQEWGFDLDTRWQRLQNLAAGNAPAILAAQQPLPSVSFSCLFLFSRDQR